MDQNCARPYLNISKDYTEPIDLTQIRPRAAVPYFTMSQIAKIYKIPTPNPSTPIVVGVISFGGGLYGSVGSDGLLTGGDVQAYWSYIGIPIANHPRVIVVTVDGGVNAPNVNDGGATAENSLDVQTIGGACPSPNLTIILYIASPYSIFSRVLNYMLTTNITVNSVNYKPDIISCSWGLPEIYVTSTESNAVNTLLETYGINMTTATGDNGSNDGVGGSGSYTDFPSSCPNAIAVGGTNLVCPNYLYDSSTVEIAWSSGGGGISKAFSRPSYQLSIANTSSTGRSTPDIALVADPNTGVVYIVNGLGYVYGGTSVASPIFAAFLASINYKAPVHAALYSAPSSCFHDIKVGSNGAYSSKLNYDNCTGLGSIAGNLLSATLVGPILASSITLNTTSISLLAGETIQLTASVLPIDTTLQEVTWSSSSTSVATVSASGLVTAVGAGTVAITARSIDSSNLFATCVVNVNATTSVTSIVLSPSNATLNINTTAQLEFTVDPSDATNPAILWASSNPTIVEVSQSGILTAKEIGSSIITASSLSTPNILSNNATITVRQPATSITLNKTIISIITGRSSTILATILPSNASNNVAWSSSNLSIATVTTAGLVTGISPGSAVITAKTTDSTNLSVICTANITPVIPINTIKLNIPASTITLVSPGNTLQLISSISPLNATNAAVTWSSSNTNVTVSKTGLVTSKAIGTAIVSVRSVDNPSVFTSTAITVSQPITTLSINQTSLYIGVGTLQNLTTVILPISASNKTLLWTSSILTVANLNASGQIRAISPGITVIKATATDGSNKTATTTVTVVGVTISISKTLMIKGSRLQATATVSPSSLVNKSVTWSSTYPFIASVSKTGLITANSTTAGTTSIVATSAYGAIAGIIKITVE